jgi:hypothetical protein
MTSELNEEPKEVDPDNEPMMPKEKELNGPNKN